MSKNICIIVDRLSSGGAERVSANLSISLSKRGYNVTLVLMRKDVDYSYQGEIFNLGLIKEKHNNFKAFLLFNNFIKKSKFDVIIDQRVRSKFWKELLFSKFIFFRKKVIYVVHSFNLRFYFSFLNWPNLALLPHVKKSSFVSVSDEIKEHLYKKINLKSFRIYNYALQNQMASHNMFEEQNNYIIGVGRLVKTKQFDILINAYNNSKLKDNNIKLLILGDGLERENLISQINSLKLEAYVKILPFKKNPYALIKNAKAMVLASKTEGFPMVLIEALLLNTPVISFNCKSGPKEIIEHRKNGLLVEDQTADGMKAALEELLLDINLYSKIKKTIPNYNFKFHEEEIIKQWIHLIESQS